MGNVNLQIAHPSGTYRAALPARTAAPAPRLLVINSQPLLVLLAATVLVASMLIFILSAIGGVRYTLTRPNPFAPFGALLPGEAASILARYDCEQAPSVQRYDARLQPEAACFIFPRDPWFHLIQVYAVGGQIKEVQFFSETLQPEVLFAAWGQPDRMTMNDSRRSVVMTWDRGSYRAKVTVGEDDRVARLINLTAN